jgi:hypothetical protein
MVPFPLLQDFYLLSVLVTLTKRRSLTKAAVQQPTHNFALLVGVISEKHLPECRYRNTPITANQRSKADQPFYIRARHTPATLRWKHVYLQFWSRTYSQMGERGSEVG